MLCLNTVAGVFLQQLLADCFVDCGYVLAHIYNGRCCCQYVMADVIAIYECCGRCYAIIDNIGSL